ncbi:hypothetical protein BCR42DRAFT_423207 [Absidia repens]|uniref:Uncharacterized protein n=1 Tax=Absidia repens TaxID=90262 RepID=A0A1X2I715_9FUNG|nr:hypothetical protein BCR42DRAFT_423207 [Absidia repens]
MYRQKESDITWLYGPFYSTKPVLTTSTSTPTTSTTTQGIKSVLKKPTSTSLSTNTYRPWSKTCSEPGTSPISVRFNPDIEQLEYIPESPVQETMASDSDYWSLHDDDEDDEDDILWSVVVNLSQFVKNKSTSLVTSFLSSTLSTLSSSTSSSSSTNKQHLPQQQYKHQYQHHYQQHHYSQQQQQQKSNLATSSDISRETPLHIILLFLSMTKSFTSLIGTWFMYQSLLPFTWLIKHHHSQKNHHTTF